MLGNLSTHGFGRRWVGPFSMAVLSLLVMSSCGSEPTGSALLSTPPVPPPLRTRGEMVSLSPCGPLWTEGVSATVRGLYRRSGEQAYLDVVHIFPGNAEPCWARFFLREDLGLGAVSWDVPRYVEVTGRLSASSWSSAGLWDLEAERWTLLPLDVSAVQQACREAVAAQTAALQALDWAALAMPTYVTGTMGFVPSAEALARPAVRLLGADDRQPLLFLEARGPDLPPVRPLVTRWIAVECLYDLARGQVVELVATIRGEVQE